jgi:hypothetical protein
MADTRAMFKPNLLFWIVVIVNNRPFWILDQYGEMRVNFKPNVELCYLNKAAIFNMASRAAIVNLTSYYYWFDVNKALYWILKLLL